MQVSAEINAAAPSSASESKQDQGLSGSTVSNSQSTMAPSPGYVPFSTSMHRLDAFDINAMAQERQAKGGEKDAVQDSASVAASFNGPGGFRIKGAAAAEAARHAGSQPSAKPLTKSQSPSRDSKAAVAEAAEEEYDELDDD